MAELPQLRKLFAFLLTPRPRCVYESLAISDIGLNLLFLAGVLQSAASMRALNEQNSAGNKPIKGALTFSNSWKCFF